MSKKHFEQLARVLANHIARAGNGPHTQALIRDVSAVCLEFNGRFDAVRFNRRIEEFVREIR